MVPNRVMHQIYIYFLSGCFENTHKKIFLCGKKPFLIKQSIQVFLRLRLDMNPLRSSVRSIFHFAIAHAYVSRVCVSLVDALGQCSYVISFSLVHSKTTGSL